MAPDAKAAVLEAARGIGFRLAGVAPAAVPPGADALARWLDRGYEAGMVFMRRNPAKRADPRALCPWARSVVCVAVSYDGSTGDSAIARYARGHDYHDVLREMLGRLEAAIRKIGGEGTQTKTCVDTAPVLERAHARRAGLGWIGKNACLVHPTLGSRLLLGEVLTSLELDASAPLPDACGDCRACLDACHAGALVEPHVLDARRCIAYLTIEHDGPIPEDLRPAMGSSVFGCDRCQDACPWNRAEPEDEQLCNETARGGGRIAATCRSTVQRHEVVYMPWTVRRPGARDEPPPRADGNAAIESASAPASPPLCDLLSLDRESFLARFAGTPLERAGFERFLRNACVAAGNSRDRTLLPALARAAAVSAIVREHADWALARLSESPGNR